MAEPSQMLVSIIVPSFDQGRYIGEALRSCIEQDYRPLEILVVDGGSQDETTAVLGSFAAPELHWHSEPDRGVVDAVNKGMARACGAILTIQSADDVLMPGAVTAAVAAFASATRLGLVYGDVEHIDAESRVTGADVQEAFDLAAYLGRLQYIPQPGAFFTRRAMEAIGGWREAFSYAADADFWMRLALQFPVQRLDRFMARYRYHAEQRDRQRERIARDWQGAVQDLLGGGGLDARQARYARMGMHLARYRYSSEEQCRQTHPGSLRGASSPTSEAVSHKRFPKRELLPGRDPLWRQLSRIKRGLGFKPRSA
ncbi:MAG: glycosyltransferase [Gammaproteobacteria bacterium]